jgi:hypothetical protein
MLNERPTPYDEELKTEIETGIKADEKEELSLKVAESLLKISSIDKEFAALKKRAVETQFQYSSKKRMNFAPINKKPSKTSKEFSEMNSVRSRSNFRPALERRFLSTHSFTIRI